MKYFGGVLGTRDFISGSSYGTYKFQCFIFQPSVTSNE